MELPTKRPSRGMAIHRAVGPQISQGMPNEFGDCSALALFPGRGRSRTPGIVATRKNPCFKMRPMRSKNRFGPRRNWEPGDEFSRQSSAQANSGGCLIEKGDHLLPLELSREGGKRWGGLSITAEGNEAKRVPLIAVEQAICDRTIRD